MTTLWKTRVFKLCAAALALGAIGLFTPRAAHALAATLVQVTNTAANPAVAQSPNTQAGQLVELYNVVNPLNGTPIQFSQSFSNGTFSSGYTVPAGQSLVVTAVDLTWENESTSTACGTSASIYIGRGIAGSSIFWFVPGGTGTAHYAYPSGIAFAPGISPMLSGIGPSSNCVGFVYAHGYLTTS